MCGGSRTTSTDIGSSWQTFSSFATGICTINCVLPFMSFFVEGQTLRTRMSVVNGKRFLICYRGLNKVACNGLCTRSKIAATHVRKQTMKMNGRIEKEHANADRPSEVAE